MKRIIIICEGQTEQTFCNKVLKTHFSNFDIITNYPTIKKTCGGIPSWEAIKKQIENSLSEGSRPYVSTMIDLYGLHTNKHFPNFSECIKITDKYKRTHAIESAMHFDVREDLRDRFLPYIQLHEFEGLLFSDSSAFEALFDRKDYLDYNYLQKTFRESDNPELINNGEHTAPSKRLLKSIEGYNKRLHGELLATHIGLDKIREKCSHFNEWIQTIEELE